MTNHQLLHAELIYDDEFLKVRPLLLNYLHRLTAHRQDAEDLVSDVYLKMKNQISTLRDPGKFKPWIFAIATNHAMNHFKVRARWRPDAQDINRKYVESDPAHLKCLDDAFQSQPETRFDVLEHINHCFTCISKNLDIQKQIAIILKDIFDFSRKEISEMLGITEGVTKHLLFEGRKELQEKYYNRCALINKSGTCYQCAELNDALERKTTSHQKIVNTGLTHDNTDDKNYEIRINIVKAVDPINGNGHRLEDLLYDFVRAALDSKETSTKSIERKTELKWRQ